jgi:phosphoserine phosphatase
MCSADSPGRSTLKTDPVLIFDLDGTILSVNSFPYWAGHMLRGQLNGLSTRRRLALALGTGQILFSRKVLRQSHYRTKRQLQALWSRVLPQHAHETALQGLSNTLLDHIRPNLRSLMKAVASGDSEALLATSAAAEYAHGLGKKLGFSHILATPTYGESDSLENCRERKRDRVLATLAAQGWDRRRRIFFTDHEEDLPLIRECQRTLWFGPDEEAPSVQARAPQADIIACRNRPETEILRLASGG